MHSKVIVTVDLGEAESVKELIESLPVMAPAPTRFKLALAFNAKLTKAIQRAKRVKDGKSE